MPSLWPQLLLLASLSTCIILAPYTKVEESFTLHAVKDLLDLTDLEKFDHVAFPGAVPRSFLGPLLLAILSMPILILGHLSGLITTSLHAQVAIRLTLAATNSVALIFFAHKVERVWRKPVADLFLLCSATQFHLVFWLSRTLPNSVAFPLVITALGLFIEGDVVKATKTASSYRIAGFALLAFVANVLRIELLALIAPLVLFELCEPTGLYFETLFRCTFGFSLLSQLLSLAVDSYFWRTLIWPEGFSFLFNVFENRSSEWGVQPWHFYFSNALPRTAHISVPFSILSFTIDRRLRQLIGSNILFVCALSLLGHKEWRFAMYSLPIFNLGAAVAAQAVAHVFSRKLKELFVFALLFFNITFLVLGTHVSLYNYPGGAAVEHLLALAHHASKPLSIHIDSATAMTGASKFTFDTDPRWYTVPTPYKLMIDRTETFNVASDFENFDYIVTANPSFHQEFFDVVEPIHGFFAFSLDNRRYTDDSFVKYVQPNDLSELLPYSIFTVPRLYVMKNARFRKRSAYI